MTLSPRTYTLLCGCFAALGSILFGYDLAVIAGVLVAPDFLHVANHPDSDYTGFIASSMLLGAFAGCIPAGLIADKFSRRSAILTGALVFILGGALQTGARSRDMMLAGRFFAGFGIGMLALLAPLYQSEIASPSMRGRLTSLQQFFLGVGATLASFIVYACNTHAPGTALEWRLPLGLQLLPAVPLAALIFLFPESPRWLMMVGREQEAYAAIARLHARGDVSDPFVQAQMAEMKAALAVEQATDQGWKQILGNAQNFRKVMIGIILQFSVQITGVSAIQYYAPTIYASMGFSSSKTFLLQSFNNIVGVIAELFTIIFLDRAGRRWPLISCNLISGVCFAVVTAIQAHFPNSGPKFSQSAAVAFVAMLWLYNAAFSFGIGPLSWVVPVELLNTSIRAKGTALTSMSCWIANFMIGQVTPKALNSIGWKYYILFTIGGFTNALTFYLILPETRGRTLEEMDEYIEQTPWIVIFRKDQRISLTEREEELKRGIAHMGGELRNVQDMPKTDKGVGASDEDPEKQSYDTLNIATTNAAL